MVPGRWQFSTWHKKGDDDVFLHFNPFSIQVIVYILLYVSSNESIFGVRVKNAGVNYVGRSYKGKHHQLRISKRIHFEFSHQLLI